MTAKKISEPRYTLELSDYEAGLLLSLCNQHFTIPAALRSYSCYSKQFVESVQILMNNVASVLNDVGVNRAPVQYQ